MGSWLVFPLSYNDCPMYFGYSNILNLDASEFLNPVIVMGRVQVLLIVTKLPLSTILRSIWQVKDGMAGSAHSPSTKSLLPFSVHMYCFPLSSIMSPHVGNTVVPDGLRQNPDSGVIKAI